MRATQEEVTMTRRMTLYLLGFLYLIASATAVAQTTPTINGRVNGIEFCAQSLCGYAWFAGTFIGKVGDLGNNTAAWVVRVTHDSLDQTNKGVTLVTGGDWMLVLSGDVSVSGTIDPGGTLTYRAGNNTFDVDLALTITQGGSGKLNFDGTLNHSVFPPPITGRMSSK
jgi:hypothetical protein